MSIDVGRVGLDCSTFGANRDWDLQPCFEDAVFDFVACQRGVPACDRCVRLCCTFNRSPVLAQSDSHCIDSIHNSLIVRGGSKVIKFGKPLRFQNLGRHFFTTCSLPCQCSDRNFEGRQSHTLCAQVCQDPDAHLALIEKRVDVWRCGLCNRVDDVGAHGLTDVNK